MRRPPLISALAVALPLLFTVCATVGPPLPPSLDLPKPPTDLRAVRKGDHVTLTWTIPTQTTDRQTIRSLGHTRICRGAGELKECGTPVGETPTQLNPAKSASSKHKPQGTFTDAISAQLVGDSASSITYAVEVFNPEGRGAGISNQVHVNLAHTLPAPTDLQAQVTSRGIVLTWTSTVPSIIPAGTHYVYRVYRRLDGSSEQSLASEIPAEPGMSLTPTDSNIEWERTYEYHAEAVTVIDQPGRPSLQIEGDDSAEIKVFADDVFPPAVPSGLQAVFSGPGQKPFIDLIWAPVSDVDLAGYNVYRHEEGAVPVKVNAELVKTPAYRDADVASGKRYVYSVAAVDLRGNESARSSEANESVP